MAVPPNRMTAYQNARAAAQPAPSTSILDLGPDAFVSALNELGLQGEERSFLEQQYFAKNRALPMTPRPEGKRIGMVAPIAFPEGMTGGEALMSGNFEVTAPEFIRGMYEAPAEAVNVAGAAARGVPVTQQQMQDASQGLAEVMTGVGPARAATRVAAGGRSAAEELMDASTVSMSGARGMGDNGGPAMAPQRHINPKTGLYSPSYEAAKALPQEVGTAQQMRSMLLKGGAKEEELVYSGFDDWLQGKDKVTKQEIQDVLALSAAGLSEGMPYARVSQTARGGVTGVQGMSIGDLQDSIYEQMLEDYNTQRRERLFGSLQERGYSFPQLRDEGAFRDFAARAQQQQEVQRTPGYRGPTAPASIMNTIRRVEGLLNRGEPFEGFEIRQIIRDGIESNTHGIVRPDGSLTYTYDAISNELPDEEPALDLSRGSMPEEARDRAMQAYRMTPEQAADYLGIDVEDVLESFDPGNSTYGQYVVPGMKGYSENQYMYRDEGRGVLSGIESLGVMPFGQSHFSAGRKPLMFFTLTGELNTPEGFTHHVAQLQSDIGQEYKKSPDQFFVPGSTPTRVQFSEPDRQQLRSYVDQGRRLRELQQDADNKFDKLWEDYQDPQTGDLMKDAPGYAEASEAVRLARNETQAAKEQLNTIELDNIDLLEKIVKSYGNITSLSSPRDANLDRFENILSGKEVAKRSLRNKSTALPFATSTNRWVDAALKNELIKAAESGAEWFTLPMGEDVQRYTYGDLEGQQEFYEKIVPIRLKELSKKFLDGAEIQQIKAKGFGSKPPTYRVNALRLTPELRAKLLEGGLPSFAKGGPVNGSSLDVDVFAFP